MSEYHVAPKDDFFRSDLNFNDLYPDSIQLLARRHWTPLHIARLVAGFLAGDGHEKILDIGSGAGKFCLAAAHYAPDSRFYGVEQRDYLIGHALAVQKALGVKNVSFLRGNFTQLDLSQFNHFYFYNSFYENLEDQDRIDELIPYSEAIYARYVRHLHAGLKQMPKGTKVVTYHSLNEEIPLGYELVETLENGDLNFWRKR
jgi:SAM-dependent methyltransferase